MAELLERELDVLGSQLASVVGVELLEDSPQPVICQELLNVDCGGEELAIVDLAVALIVDLVYHIFDLLVRHAELLLLKVVTELLCVDHASAISIHLLEHLAQVLDLVL